VYGSRPLVPLEEEALRDKGIRIVVKNYLEKGGDGDSLKHRFIDSLGGVPVVSFSPYRDSGRKWEPDPLIGTACQPHRRSDLFARTRPGPYLEIYELKD
ncbi:MAG TPA: hypothetical protein VL404_03940, partial [Candidatus Eisenbacteria bacterium]|nr:hypothetical protein [Candidatus Eisenbacteria bacterium]